MSYDIDLGLDEEDTELMKYESDDRTLTMEDLEKILCKVYGSSEYDRESGCYHNGKWFSVDNILEAVSDYI